MDWRDFAIQNIGSTLGVLERTLNGLTQEDLDWQPKPGCNSIGWTTWHLTRAMDSLISSLTGEEELWTKDGWCSKFNRPSDFTDTGFGHGPEQLAAFKSPGTDILLDYHRAALERTRNYLSTLSSSDLDQKIDDNWAQMFPSIGSRLVVLLGELEQHGGQVAYIRGLLQGHGWQ
ncbi:MAG: DinB family protein [Dehalococcoidales bacterium]|nr:MAG: DinB family protein [Dehalococcoidales bacterium]